MAWVSEVVLAVAVEAKGVVADAAVVAGVVLEVVAYWVVRAVGEQMPWAWMTVCYPAS